VRDTLTRLQLVPVMLERGAQSHPRREMYRAYLHPQHLRDPRTAREELTMRQILFPGDEQFWYET
jgi:hypothetical protein